MCREERLCGQQVGALPSTTLLRSYARDDKKLLGMTILGQVLVEPADRAFENVDLILGLTWTVTFVGVDDEL